VTSQDRLAPRTPQEGRTGEPSSFDTTVAHPARVYDYWLGGKDNYEADRDAGDQVQEVLPYIREGARANRAFLRRAVEYLAGEAGIRQFLDIGTGLPTADNTHEVAQRIAPDSRIVYVDNDPIVLAHARALLDSTPQGATAYIQADARDPHAILREAAASLDLAQPVAVMMLAILHFIPEGGRQIVATLMDALAPGSYLVISVLTRDIDTDRVAAAAAAYNSERVAARVYPRTLAETAGYFAGLDLVEPGLVPIQQWHAPPGPAHLVPGYGGVARKPGARKPVARKPVARKPASGA
jgi:O-methyltransferase involved in polyketide biosynthesis